MIISPMDVRYARAFYQTLSAENKLEAVLADVQLLSDFFAKTSALAFFRKNAPMQAYLLDFLQQSFQKYVDEKTIRFFRFLGTKHRLNHLPCIVEAFLKHHRRCLGEVEAKLVLAYPADEMFLQKIQTKIEQKTNKKCHLLVEIDKKLIGGFCVYFDNVAWDCSLLGQMQKLEKTLTQRA